MRHPENRCIQRERTRGAQHVRNVADTGESGGERCRQDNGPWSWDVDGVAQIAPDMQVDNSEIATYWISMIYMDG